MQAFLVSAGLVAVSEVGDKTQLLSLLLAARFKRPIPIILGIVAATVLNHALAAALGGWAAGLMGPDVLRWTLGALFIGMGLWALKPDTLDADEKLASAVTTLGVFWITTVAFFLAEIGDKTQIATAALAARYEAFIPVVAGTTLGMLIADVPAVYLGRHAGAKVQAPWVRYVAATLFIGMGALTALVG
ncbi:MAG: TMEM165/GDT1 family protein [Rhodospirillaceae bacterium]|nr:TMEM165/GDT1 family protein [Rhodospirillaceae bacterium]